MSCTEKFKNELKERGFRFTPQREVILDALHRVQGFTTAEELYEEVRRVEPGLDLATVYRTLELLAELDFVTCIETGKKERLWEFTGAEDPHPHMFCRSCGALVGFEEDELADLRTYLSSRYGFAAATGQLTISGLCRACREREASERS